MTKSKKGVIIFSLGSLVPFSTLRPEIKQELFDTFKSFSDYHFIIKIDAEDAVETKKMVKNYANIDVTEWFPQSDMLGKKFSNMAHMQLRL